MTSNIPDQVSHDELKKLLEIEIPGIDENEPLYDGYTTSELVELCHDAKDSVIEKCKHPMAHKVLAMLIIEHCLQFHKDVGARRFNEEESDALAWAKDAGKLESARRLFADVAMGESDWFVNWDFTSTDEDCC